MIHHHIDSGIALATGLISFMGGAVGHSIAQTAQAPDWISLVSGPAGALVVGGFFLKHQISQSKKQESRTQALEAKHDEFLERTLTLAVRSDERLVANTAVLDKVHGALTENNRLIADLRADSHDK